MMSSGRGRGPFSLRGLPLLALAPRPAPRPPRRRPRAQAAPALPTAQRPAAPRVALAPPAVQTFHSARGGGGERDLGKKGRNSSKGGEIVPHTQQEVPFKRIALLRIGPKTPSFALRKVHPGRCVCEVCSAGKWASPVRTTRGNRLGEAPCVACGKESEGRGPWPRFPPDCPWEKETRKETETEGERESFLSQPFGSEVECVRKERRRRAPTLQKKRLKSANTLRGGWGPQETPRSS